MLADVLTNNYNRCNESASRLVTVWIQIALVKQSLNMNLEITIYYFYSQSNTWTLKKSTLKILSLRFS